MVQCSFKVNIYPCTVGRGVVASEATRTSCSFRPPSKWMRPPSSSSRRWSARPSGSCHVTETEKSRMTSQWFCMGVSRLFLGWDCFLWSLLSFDFCWFRVWNLLSGKDSVAGRCCSSVSCQLGIRQCPEEQTLQRVSKVMLSIYVNGIRIRCPGRPGSLRWDYLWDCIDFTQEKCW